MSKEKLVSFDLKCDFAFFKKPDYNVGTQLSYNMIHKPVLLGILGAIVGLEGFKEKEKMPEYFEKLSHLQIGIMPLDHENGNYQKTTLRYNNGVGYANKDGNLLIDEVMLIKPSYRCFILIDMDNKIDVKLYNNILNNEAEFIPYLGKNEFQTWMENVVENEYKQFHEFEYSYNIDSLFVKSGVIKNMKVEPEINFDFSVSGGTYTYFERLPITFDTEHMQYEMAEFALTDWKIKSNVLIPNLITVDYNGNDINVQLF